MKKGFVVLVFILCVVLCSGLFTFVFKNIKDNSDKDSSNTDFSDINYRFLIGGEEPKGIRYKAVLRNDSEFKSDDFYPVGLPKEDGSGYLYGFTANTLKPNTQYKVSWSLRVSNDTLAYKGIPFVWFKDIDGNYKIPFSTNLTEEDYNLNYIYASSGLYADLFENEFYFTSSSEPDVNFFIGFMEAVYVGNDSDILNGLAVELMNNLTLTISEIVL